MERLMIRVGRPAARRPGRSHHCQADRLQKPSDLLPLANHGEKNVG